LTIVDEQPTFDLVHKGDWDFNGLKFKHEAKVSTTANHSVKINHATDIGNSKAELENEFSFNTSTNEIKNRFALSNQIDRFRH